MESLATLSRGEKEMVVLALAEKARRRFLDYCCYMDPAFEAPRHVCLVADKLEAVERGEIRRIMFFEPPRHGKTTEISKKFPAWFLGRRPDENVILSSYAYSLVKTYSRDVRDTIESRLYRTIFDITTKDDSRMVNDFDIAEHRGGLLAQGVGGAITGYGANLFIIDDPFKDREEADSSIIREKVWEWYRNVVLTRLEPGARLVLIMTRWHRDDLAGRILNEEKDWDVVNLPAVATGKPDPYTGLPDLLGRAECEALWPERFNAEELAVTKTKVGSRVWEALYQGNPTDPETQKFKREWFRWYDELPHEAFALPRGAGVDTATSLKSSNDNTALVEVCRDEKGFLYVDDVFCEKVTVSGFAEYLVNQHAAKQYAKVKLEKNNAGEAFKQRIDEVSRERKIAVPVECEQTTTDKMVRAMEFQPFVENGTLRFKRGHKRVAELVEHLINFDGRGGDVDDDVDALGFAIKAILNTNEGGMFALGDVMPK